MNIGTIVKNSPVGAGTITEFSERGFPKVNGVAVAWLILESGEIFNPYGIEIK